MIFLKIKLEFLEGTKSAPCPVFLYEPYSKKRSISFYQGREVTEETFEKALLFEEKGGIFQILFEDYDNFCEATSTHKDRVYLINKEQLELEKLQASRREKSRQVLSTPFHFKTELTSALENQDFSSLYKRAISQIESFSLSLSKWNSSVIQFLLTQLQRDSWQNKESVFLLFTAQSMKIKDESALLSLIFANYFKYFGLSQLDYRENVNAYTKDSDYKKFSAYTIFLLKKMPIEWDPLFLRFLLEFKEEFDGKGIPRGKKEDEIHILSQLLGASSLIFSELQYSDTPLKQSVKKLSSNLQINDKQWSYHPEVISALEVLFDL